VEKKFQGEVLDPSCGTFAKGQHWWPDKTGGWE